MHRAGPAPRQSRLGRGVGALALVAAPLLVCLRGYPEAEPFVTEVPGLLCRPAPAPPRGLQRIICHAGTEIETEGMPGGIPDSSPDRDDPGDAPLNVKELDPRALRKMEVPSKGVRSPLQQEAYRELKGKQIKRLKGKFVPRGPKPWEPPCFKAVHVLVILEQAQATNKKIMNQIMTELRLISGALPEVVNAKKNDAQKNVRKGYPIGAVVRLKRKLMRDFLNRLNTIVLPRVRDFEGLWPNNFDNHGQYWLHIPSQEPFKELDEMIDEREVSHPFMITINTNCMTQPRTFQFMKDYGFPFRDDLRPKKKVEEPAYGDRKVWAGDPRR